MTLTGRARAALAVFVAIAVSVAGVWLLVVGLDAAAGTVIALVTLLAGSAFVGFWVTRAGHTTVGTIVDSLGRSAVWIVAGTLIWGGVMALVAGSVLPFVAAATWAILGSVTVLSLRFVRNSDALRSAYYRLVKKVFGKRRRTKKKRVGLSSPLDYEHAARRGFAIESLKRLEAMATAEPEIGENGRETVTSRRRRARSLIHRALILDQIGRVAEGDVEARRSYDLDPTLTFLGERAAARVVSMFARAGDSASAVRVIAALEKERGFEPRLELQQLAAGVAELSGDERLAVLNMIYRRAGVPHVERRDPSAPVTIDNLRGVVTEADYIHEGPLVTVAIPSFNAEDSIDFVLESVLAQTYRNIEVIVVDDASSDGTCAKVEQWIARDPRVRLESNPVNSGAYVSRNHALRKATGKYILVRDADDWGHPSLIAVLVRGMREHGDHHGAIIDHIRTTGDLVAVGPITHSFASLMVDVELLHSVGGWHEVRIGADSELFDRLRLKCGRDFVRPQLQWVPLSLAFVGESNLTTDGPRAVRYVHHVAGVRALYRLAAMRWRASDTFSGRAPVVEPVDERPFVIPRLMDPALHGQVQADEFDVVFVADLMGRDDRASLADAEIAAFAQAGLRVGVINQPRYPDHALGTVRETVWSQIDGTRVRFVTVGEHVSTDLLWVSDIRLGAFLIDEYARIDARRAAVGVDPAVAATPPIESKPYVDLAANLARLEEKFGIAFGVAPRGPRARTLLESGAHGDAIGQALIASDVPTRVAPDLKDGPRKDAQFVAIADSHGVFVVPALPAWKRSMGRATASLPGVRSSRASMSWKAWSASPKGRAELLSRSLLLEVHRTVRGDHLRARVVTDAAIAGVPVIADGFAEAVLEDAYGRAHSRREERRVMREFVANGDLRSSVAQRAHDVVAERMAPSVLLGALGFGTANPAVPKSADSA